MFHLSPQEKSVVAGLLTVCLLGTCLHVALTRNFRAVHWMKSTIHKSRPHLPDINTAAAQELDRVPGIGPKTAQAIIDYRTQHGPFLSLQGLRRVRGITKARLEKIIAFYAQGAAHE